MNAQHFYSCFSASLLLVDGMKGRYDACGYSACLQNFQCALSSAAKFVQPRERTVLTTVRYDITSCG
jgi:hypothetical protein